MLTRLLAAVLLIAPSGYYFAHAANDLPDQTEVIQTINAWQNGTPLPSSTGQAVDYARCKRVIESNFSIAAALSYTVDKAAGTFTDPASNITIKQGCTPAAPFYIPAPGLAGGALPTFAKIPCPAQTPDTEVWYIIGQSNASNLGDGRYTARSGAFMYGWDNDCYQASDPIVGADGNGAGPWARLADLMLGQTGLNGQKIGKIIIINRAVGGSAIRQWGPGGIFSRTISRSLTEAKASGYTPTRIFWVQGESDVAVLSTEQYVDAFGKVLDSIRQLGVAAPVWVAQTTMCNMRSLADLNDRQVIERPPNNYILLERGRLSIRAAQKILGDQNHAGASLDSIDIGLRRDGCHMGSYGLDQEARLWFRALTGNGAQ